MSDALSVQEGNGLDDLKKDSAHERVLAKEDLVVNDGVEKIGSRDEVENEEDESRGGDDSMERDDGRVGGHAPVKLDLGLKEVGLLRGAERVVQQRFDSCRKSVGGVERVVGQSLQEVKLYLGSRPE
jgi:hypothetical protein